MENKPKDTRSLDERLAAYPEIREQLMRMTDELEQRAGGPGGLDEAEEAMVALVRQLGREMLEGCARQMAAQAAVPVGRKVRRQIKKKSAG